MFRSMVISWLFTFNVKMSAWSWRLSLSQEFGSVGACGLWDIKKRELGLIARGGMIKDNGLMEDVVDGVLLERVGVASVDCEIKEWEREGMELCIKE